MTGLIRKWQFIILYVSRHFPYELHPFFSELDICFVLHNNLAPIAEREAAPQNQQTKSNFYASCSLMGH